MFVLKGYTIHHSRYMCHLLLSYYSSPPCQSFGRKLRMLHVSVSGFWLWHTHNDFIWFCRLEEGRYLIAHKAGEPFVTLLKEANGKGSRGAYNLQQLHSAVPQRPASGLVPWIPVDPAVVLPFHQKHSRVPCTFPPKLSIKVCTRLASS